MGSFYLPKLLYVLVASALLCGCEAATTHRVLVTFFDEVPALPPAAQYCQEAEEQQARQKTAEVKEPVKVEKKDEGSVHPPYGDKRCNDCHQSDKTSISGLLKPQTELCFMCHPKIIKHRFVHGPAAEGECLGCHLPHEASYPSLLARKPAALCEKCHTEPRSAAGMHDRIKTTGVICIECHDPHSGENRYFLK